MKYILDYHNKNYIYRDNNNNIYCGTKDASKADKSNSLKEFFRYKFNFGLRYPHLIQEIKIEIYE